MSTPPPPAAVQCKLLEIVFIYPQRALHTQQGGIWKNQVFFSIAIPKVAQKGEESEHLYDVQLITAMLGSTTRTQ